MKMADITCTLRKVTAECGKIQLHFTTADESQFSHLLTMIDDPVVLNVETAQGELALTEETE